MGKKRKKNLAPVSLPAAPEKQKQRINPEAVAWCGAPAEPRVNPFQIVKPMPGVVPADAEMAMDSGIQVATDWAGGFSGQFGSGPQWLGYQFLAELAQQPEYRRMSETIAKEMTRKWITLQADGDESKSERIADLDKALDKFKVQDVFRRVAELDGFFGRAHVYLDTGDTANDNELSIPLVVDPRKIKKGGLKRLGVVEPVWTYPNSYDSTNPLADNFYRPDFWFVMSRKIHRSRLLTFVGREMPDLLKPAYQFGGLSLTQMAMPYVNNWLRAQSACADLITNYSVNGIATDLTDSLAGGDGQLLFQRAAMFNQAKANRGLMLINKDTEEFFNVSTPLSTIDKLQAQAQEHMASVSGIPLVKLLGITPSGLNASSDGEIQVFYDWIHAQQEHLFSAHLKRIIDIIQLSEFGEIDPSITFRFNPLWQQNEVELATIRKQNADTAAVYIADGVLSAEEERDRLAREDDGIYHGLDLSITPEPPDAAEDPDLGEGMKSEPKEVAADKAPFEESKHPRSDDGKFGTGSHTKLSRPLTEQQAVDLKDYKEGGYRALNEHLRSGGGSKDYEALAKRIDGSIAKSTLKTDVVLFRGIQHDSLAKNAEQLIGKDVSIVAFQSASTDSRVAAEFAGHAGGGAVFKIQAKAGHPAIDMSSFETSGNAGEKEFLLPRGGKLRITNVDRSGRIPVITAEPVGWNNSVKAKQVAKIGADSAEMDSRFGIGPDEAQEVFGEHRYAQDADFREEDHPRDSDGKFGSGIASSEATKEPIKSPPGTQSTEPKPLEEITPEQKEAIKSYTGADYRQINGHLRGGTALNEKGSLVIAHMDELLKEAALPEATVLYRGLGSLAVQQMLGAGVKKGDYLQDPGFMSSSVVGGVADQFFKVSPKNVLMAIKAPKGAKALDISKYSDDPSEKETLIARGSYLKVVKYDSKLRRLEVELMPEGFEPPKKGEKKPVKQAQDAAAQEKTDPKFERFVYEDLGGIKLYRGEEEDGE